MTEQQTVNILTEQAKHPLADCLRELRWGRPTAAQRFLDETVRRLEVGDPKSCHGVPAEEHSYGDISLRDYCAITGERVPDRLWLGVAIGAAISSVPWIVLTAVL